MLRPLLGLGSARDIRATFLYQYASENEPGSVDRFFAGYPWVESFGVPNRNLLDLWDDLRLTRLPVDVLSQMDLAYYQELEHLLRRRRYDIVQVEHSQMSWVVPLVRSLAPHAKVVLDLHNVESRIFERWIDHAAQKRSRLETAYQKMLGWEREVWRWYHACLAVSPQEAETFRQETGGLIPTFELPTGGGVDLERFPWPPPDGTEHDGNAIYVGTMDWFPNAQGLAWFVDEVLPLLQERLPESRLRIAGRGSPMNELVQRVEGRADIELLGEVEDERPPLWQGGVFVVPLWIAAGARVKIITAWAAGIPVVATAIGAEGLACTHDKDILLADQPAEFAAAIYRVLTEPALRDTLSQNGRNLVESRYSLAQGVRDLGEAYLRLIEDPAATPQGIDRALELPSVSSQQSSQACQTVKWDSAGGARPASEDGPCRSGMPPLSTLSDAARFGQKSEAIRDLLSVKADLLRHQATKDAEIKELAWQKEQLLARATASEHHLQTILASPPYRAWGALRGLLPRPIRRWLGSPV